jgi:hypothetical protein
MLQCLCIDYLWLNVFAARWCFSDTAMSGIWSNGWWVPPPPPPAAPAGNIKFVLSTLKRGFVVLSSTHMRRYILGCVCMDRCLSTSIRTRIQRNIYCKCLHGQICLCPYTHMQQVVFLHVFVWTDVCVCRSTHAGTYPSCVCMDRYVFMPIHTCTKLFICACVRMDRYMCMCIHTCRNVAFMCLYGQVCVYGHTHMQKIIVFACACMDIYIYIYIYVYVHTHMQKRILHVFVWTGMCQCPYTHAANLFFCMCLYGQIYVYVHTHMQKYICCMCLYGQIYVCVHMHMHTNNLLVVFVFSLIW